MKLVGVRDETEDIQGLIMGKRFLDLGERGWGLW